MLAFLKSKVMVGVCGCVTDFNFSILDILSYNHPRYTKLVKFARCWMSSSFPSFVGTVWMMVIFFAISAAHI